MPTDPRAGARALILAALRSVAPARLVAEALADPPTLLPWGGGIALDGAGPPTSPLDASAPGDTLLVAIGKAAGGMAEGAAAVLGAHLAAGVVVVPDEAPLPDLPPALRVHRAAHPVPDARSVEAGRDIRGLLEGAGPDDRVLFLLSGGGSALVSEPERGVDLDTLRATHEVLLGSGWSIHRINDVRRLLDRLKGGGMARLASPARIVALVLSDIPGGALEDVASGPLSPSHASPRDVEIALRRDRLWELLPSPVRDFVVARRAWQPPETPPVELRGIGAGVSVIDAVARQAQADGRSVRRLGAALEGEARVLGRALARAAMAAQDGAAPVPLPTCLVGAGEATVTVRGSGSGGPNQEVAVAAALALDGRRGILVASVGTDGVDGPTSAAGGFADGTTAERARAAGVDLATALERNDSGSALEALGDRIVTGPTGTNVADLYLVLVEAPDTPGEGRG